MTSLGAAGDGVTGRIAAFVEAVERADALDQVVCPTSLHEAQPRHRSRGTR